MTEVKDATRSPTSDLSDRVPIPPKTMMNQGLSSATESLMLKTFGKPGPLSQDCTDPDGKVKNRIKFGIDVGPFKVSGLGKAVIPQGQQVAQRGVFLLSPFFNHHGWYWGAEFSGDSVDSMHFELAQETILKLASVKL